MMISHSAVTLAAQLNPATSAPFFPAHGSGALGESSWTEFREDTSGAVLKVTSGARSQAIFGLTFAPSRLDSVSQTTHLGNGLLILKNRSFREQTCVSKDDGFHYGRRFGGSHSLLCKPCAGSRGSLHPTLRTLYNKFLNKEPTNVVSWEFLATASLSRDLGEGDYGSHVKELQKVLLHMDYLQGTENITGYFGPLTKKALKRFQMAQGVPSTGYWGELSRKAFHSYVDALATKQMQESAVEQSVTKPLVEEVKGKKSFPLLATNSPNLFSFLTIHPQYHIGGLVLVSSMLLVFLVSQFQKFVRSRKNEPARGRRRIVNLQKIRAAQGQAGFETVGLNKRRGSSPGLPWNGATSIAHIPWKPNSVWKGYNSQNYPYNEDERRGKFYTLPGPSYQAQPEGLPTRPNIASSRNIGWRRQLYADLVRQQNQNWLTSFCQSVLSLATQIIERFVEGITVATQDWSSRGAQPHVLQNKHVAPSRKSSRAHKQFPDEDEDLATGIPGSRGDDVHNVGNGSFQDSDRSSLEKRLEALRLSAEAAELDRQAAMEALAAERSRIIELEMRLQDERRAIRAARNDVHRMQYAHERAVISLRDKYKSPGAARAAADMVLQDHEANLFGQEYYPQKAIEQ